jgi:hypothetical protein
MFIGDILVSQGLVTPADIAAALEHQKSTGARLGESLIALGKLTQADLDSVMHSSPNSPRTIADTGISLHDLISLMTKAMYSGNVETRSMIADTLKLPPNVIQQLIEQAQERKLLNVLGAVGQTTVSELRYALTEKGRQWAIEALAQNQYVGPAPVSLDAYKERIWRQRITNERVDRGAIQRSFGGLVASGDFVAKIGPAVNSGRTILLYGAAGNGKTSFAERIGGIFSDLIYIPYCFEVEGQIIKVYDPGIHQTISSEGDRAGRASIRRDDFDRRWILCRRPFIVTGGELTLEMLDLSFNAAAKFYEAPLHIKALGGTFLIDDFGRQIISPEALLNRWIVPMGSRIEYLKLHTGKGFSIPFDELVIFSTNLAPSDLMDPAFLRRIPYKIEIPSPGPEEFRQIFRMAAKAVDLEAPDAMIDLVIKALREDNDFPLASYQPKFIIDQARAACKFDGVTPQLRPELISMALDNLYTRDTPGYGVRAENRKPAQK